jgi:hypothetical protein
LTTRVRVVKSCSVGPACVVGMVGSVAWAANSLAESDPSVARMVTSLAESDASVARLDTSDAGLATSLVESN